MVWAGHMGPIWPRCKVREGLPLSLTLLQVVFTRLPRHGRETLKTGKTGRGGQRRRTRRNSTRSSSLEETGVDSVGGEPNERRGPLYSREFFQMLHKYSSEAVQMCTLCLWSCFFYLSLSCFFFYNLPHFSPATTHLNNPGSCNKQSLLFSTASVRARVCFRGD